MENNKFLWAIGVVGIILACCSVTFLTALGQLLFQLKAGDVFSLGQLSVELILIPTVIVGFIATIIQFRESQEAAKPLLYWENSTGKVLKSIELTIPSGNGFIQTPQLVVFNDGKAITNWFLVQLDLPREVVLENEPRVTRLIGEPLKSIERDEHWYVKNLEEKQSWLFMSNGQYALYPNYPQPLCLIHLSFKVGESYPENLTIPYTIYTDKGKETKGEQKIRLIKNQKEI